MSEENHSSSTNTKLPLQGVVIFVSQQLVKNRLALHEQCTTLGGKFVWIFDVPFTHYVCQGKLSKKGKEYKKVEEYQAICVHPAWLKACHKFGQRVAEKLYTTTYNPKKSLNFVSTDDEEEENHIPLLTTIKSTQSLKSIQTPRILSNNISKKTKVQNVTIVPSVECSTKENISTSSQESSLKISNEAETMLNDLESSLAQFLNNNTNTNSVTISRSSINDDDQNRKSLQIIRTIKNINNNNDNCKNIEPSMRIQWLDDAMQAERKKIIDEDENHINSQQHSKHGELNIGQKRPLIDSNFDQSFNNKKCRTLF